MHEYKQTKHHPTDDSDQDSETAIGGRPAEESADRLNQFRMVRNNTVTKLDSTGLITVDHLLDEGIPLENVQAAFQDPDLWNQLINFMKTEYSSLTDNDFHGLTQDAKNRFGNTAPDATIKSSVEQDIFETDDDITKDLERLFDYHQNIKIKLKGGADMIFRGDARPPEDISENRFTPRGENENLTKYVHSNEESIFVGFTTCEKNSKNLCYTE